MKKATVLIVDDDIDFLNANRTALEAAGYQVLTAHNGGEGMKIALDNQVDVLVAGVGTGGTITGTGEYLREHANPGIRIVAVEPAESSVLLGGQPGPHKIEGVGIGYRPPLWDGRLVDEIVAVGSLEAAAMARRLAREEALFAGTSTGANVLAALEVAGRLGPGARVVTLAADSGLKYLSGGVYVRR